MFTARRQREASHVNGVCPDARGARMAMLVASAAAATVPEIDRLAAGLDAVR